VLSGKDLAAQIAAADYFINSGCWANVKNRVRSERNRSKNGDSASHIFWQNSIPRGEIHVFRKRKPSTEVQATFVRFLLSNTMNDSTLMFRYL
jgi:hypothetical protein